MTAPSGVARWGLYILFVFAYVFGSHAPSQRWHQPEIFASMRVARVHAVGQNHPVTEILLIRTNQASNGCWHKGHLLWCDVWNHLCRQCLWNLFLHVWHVQLGNV